MPTIPLISNQKKFLGDWNLKKINEIWKHWERFFKFHESQQNQHEVCKLRHLYKLNSTTNITLLLPSQLSAHLLIADLLRYSKQAGKKKKIWRRVSLIRVLDHPQNTISSLYDSFPNGCFPHAINHPVQIHSELIYRNSFGNKQP